MEDWRVAQWSVLETGAENLFRTELLSHQQLEFMQLLLELTYSSYVCFSSDRSLPAALPTAKSLSVSRPSSQQLGFWLSGCLRSPWKASLGSGPSSWPHIVVRVEPPQWLELWQVLQWLVKVNHILSLWRNPNGSTVYQQKARMVFCFHILCHLFLSWLPRCLVCGQSAESWHFPYTDSAPVALPSPPWGAPMDVSLACQPGLCRSTTVLIQLVLNHVRPQKGVFSSTSCDSSLSFDFACLLPCSSPTLEKPDKFRRWDGKCNCCP